MSWNKNSAKVIGVTAAAAMALSLAPATAFTAYAAPRNGSSVSEQDIEGFAELFSQGHITGGEVNGTTLVYQKQTPTDEAHFEIPAGTQNAFRPTQVTLKNGQTINLTWPQNTYNGVTHTVVDGHTFALRIEGNSAVLWLGGTTEHISISLRTVSNSLSGAVASPLTYNGEPQPATFTLNGIKLNETSDYTVTYFNANGVQISTPTDAGSYSAELKGVNKYAGSDVTVNFTIAKLDLSSADLTLKNTTKPAASPLTANDLILNGQSIPGTIANKLQLKFTPNFNGNNGQYSALVSPLTANDPNISGSKNITFYHVDSTDLNVAYVGDRVPTLGHDGLSENGAVIVNLDNAKVDPSKLQVTSGTKILNTDEYKLTVLKKNADEKYVASSVNDLQSIGGQYKVIVSADPEATDPKYQFGGSRDFYFDVRHSNHTPDAVIYADGKIISDGTQYVKTYDGNNVKITADVSYTNNNKTTNLVAGKDYNLVFKNAAGNVIKEIKDAGNYTVTIDLYNGYSFGSASNHIAVQVKPVNVSVKLNDTNMISNNTYAYTGNEISPVLIFTDASGKTYQVPKSSYNIMLSYEKGNVKPSDYDGNNPDTSVTKIQDIGTYKMIVRDASSSDNYVINDNSPFYFVVTNARHFTDVSNKDWFVKDVNQAFEKGLMHGYGHSNLFGPYNKLTRAEAAVILSNWAHATISDPNETIMHNLGNRGFDTNFEDVKPATAQSRQIAWATKVGLMTGDPKTKLFRPNDPLTRQEFATIVNRFAKASQKHDGDYKAASLSALDSYSDENKVAPWARQGVAWTVANGVMGKGTNNKINPNNSIIRAEVAAMIVRADDVINK